MIKPGEKVSGVRWRWVLIAGAGAAALTFALMYLTINVYAAVLSILSRGDVDRAALDRFAGIMAVWGLPALYWLLINGAAAWLVRSLGAATVRHWPTSTKLTDSEPEGGGEAPPRDGKVAVPSDFALSERPTRSSSAEKVQSEDPGRAS